MIDSIQATAEGMPVNLNRAERAFLSMDQMDSLTIQVEELRDLMTAVSRFQANVVESSLSTNADGEAIILAPSRDVTTLNTLLDIVAERVKRLNDLAHGTHHHKPWTC